VSQRRPSIREVARAAGASTATVSNVFTGRKAVNADLEARIRSLAESMGYRPNRAAADLRSGRSRVVTMLVPDLADPHFTALVTEVESLAGADGYELLVANAKNDIDTEHGRLDALLAWQPAGLILVPCTDHLPASLDDGELPVPTVIADRGAEARGVDSVRIDNREAGELAARHLLALGHRRVLLAASDRRLEAIRERCHGAQRAIETAGGTAGIVELGTDPDEGARRLHDELDRMPLPTALIAVTDMTTLAVLTCLAERRLDPGRDLSLVGFDDYPWMRARRRPITAVAQPVAAMAGALWARLRTRMEGNDDPPSARVLHCQLRERASTTALDNNR